MAEKTAVAFIDFGYLKATAAKVLAKDHKLTFDASDMIRWIDDEGGRFLRAYWYHSELPSTHDSFEKQKSFFEAICRDDPIQVRLGSLRKQKNSRRIHALENAVVEAGGDLTKFRSIWDEDEITYQQKGVDTLLSLDMYRLAVNDAFDIAHLVCGDQDMVHAVELTQFLGKTVIVHTPLAKSVSPTLRSAADDVREISRSDLSGMFRKGRDL